MKQQTIMLWTICTLFLFGCHSIQKEEEKTGTAKSQRIEHALPTQKAPLVFERTKVEGKKDTLSFRIARPSNVHIDLEIPTNAGNIRINQVITPEGKIDGPFGKNYRDTLSTTGIYQIIIAESLMQEHPYVGRYRVEISVTR